MRVFATMLLVAVMSSAQSDARQDGMRKLLHGQRMVTTVRFINHGSRLVSADIDGSIAMWNPRTQKLLWKIDLDANSRTRQSYTVSTILGIAVSPDECLL